MKSQVTGYNFFGNLNLLGDCVMVHRLALVGCGAVSKNYYVPACRKLSECTIEWFVDTNINKAKELSKTYGGGRTSEDYREVLDDVDAAIVALPNYLHPEASIYFLEHRRDVLCEKPIATNSADALRMVEAGRRSGARLAVGLIRRQLNSCRIAKLLMDRGHFADLKQVTCEEGHVFDWPVTSSFLNSSKAGGGALLDWGTHIIDLLQWLFNADLDLVSYADDALGGVEANVDTELLVRTAGVTKIPCRIILSRTRRLRNSIVVRGDSSSLEIRQSDPDSVYLSIDGHATETRSLKGKTLLDCFVEQIDAFLDKSREDYASGTDALRSLTLIEHCYRNRYRITFPWETKTRTKPHLTFPSRYRNILLVGASGFLGTRVAERLYLDFNLRVRATTHKAHTAARVARLPLEFVDCDLLDPDQVTKAVMGCDLVINCARDRGGDAGRVRDFYIQGTSNLLEACLKHKVKKFIHMSTAAVHQFGRQEELINERSPLVHKRDPYLSGKIESEKIVLAYSRFLQVVILRPMLIYGPYSSNWVTQIIKRLENHQTTIVGDNGLANLIYVDDLVEAILLAIEQEAASGETFIINNDHEKILWKNYVQKYCEMLGISPKVSPEGSLLIQRFKNALSMVGDSLVITKELASSAEALAVLARVPLVLKLGNMILRGQKRESVQSKLTGTITIPKPDPKILSKYETISRDMYRVFTTRATFSGEKARRMLGFQAETPLEEGIAASLEWARWALGVGAG